MGKENGGIDKIREKFIRFYTIILFQTKLEKKERERWNEIVGPFRIEFFVTDSMKQTEDFEIKTLSRDSESFPKFQSYFSSIRIHVSSYRAFCGRVSNFFDSTAGGQRRGRGKGDEEERKRNAPFLYAQHPLPELVTIDIVSLISYPINSNEFSNLLIKFRANARADSP